MITTLRCFYPRLNICREIFYFLMWSRKHYNSSPYLTGPWFCSTVTRLPATIFKESKRVNIIGLNQSWEAAPPAREHEDRMQFSQWVRGKSPNVCVCACVCLCHVCGWAHQKFSTNKKGYTVLVFFFGTTHLWQSDSIMMKGGFMEWWKKSCWLLGL